MKKIILFHGLGSSPESNWIPWIQEKEEFKDVEFTVPRFPNPSKPSRSEWLKVANKIIPEDVSDTYLVGHSLGGAFIMYLLQQWHGYMPFAGVLLISAPYNGKRWEGREDLKEFGDIPFSQINFPAIVDKVRHGYILHSKNDEVVPFADAETYKEKLGYEIIATEDDGHFTKKSHSAVFQSIQKVINEA